MLSVLLLLLSVAAPLVRAQGSVFFSTEDTTVWADNVLQLESEPSPLARGTAPVELIGFPDGRGSGNQFAYQDFFGCVDGAAPTTTMLNDWEFSTTSPSSFQCVSAINAAFGRTVSSKAVKFVAGTASGSVTHTITKEVTRITLGKRASFDFFMYVSGTGETPTTGKRILPAQVTLEYSTDSYTSTPGQAVKYDRTINDPVQLLNLYNPQDTPQTVDGSWQRYVLIFTPTDATNSGDEVDLTIKVSFTRDVQAQAEMLIDDMYIRYYTFIRDPVGVELIDQDFEVCQGSTLGAEATLNSNEPTSPWKLAIEQQIDTEVAQQQQTCSTAEHGPTAVWSLLMADSTPVLPVEPLRRSITVVVDRPLQPGSEVVLEFWMRYEPSTVPEEIKRPQLSAFVEVNEADAPGWRNTAFNGQSLPGPRVGRLTENDPTTSVKTTSLFYRYRVTYTLPATVYNQGKQVRFQLLITQQVENSAPITSGTFFLDDMRLVATDLSVDPPGAVGDPQFVGLYNQNYQVHGIDGGVYNLVSSPTTQVNSRFVFLSEGKCPIFDGIPARNCFAHPGSYLGSIGIQEIVDGVNHKVTIVSGPANSGFASVEIDGMKLSVNDSVAHGTTFDVNFVSSHIVMVNTADFAFTFENSDMFINQGVAAHRRLSELTSHGLFGQTHKRVVYPSKLKYIEGEVDDYLIAEDDLFGHDFVYNQFHS